MGTLLGFTLEEAASLERLEEASRHGQESGYLLHLDEAFLDWPAMIVGAEDARRIVHGQAVQGAAPEVNRDGIPLCRAYSVDGDFLALMKYHAATDRWRPSKVFASG